MVMTGVYDPPLVALSILVASLASYTALDLGGRLEKARGRARALWLLTAAVSMGGGIWAMHFIAMLAFIMPTPMSYDVWLTALSLIVAIIVTGIGFYVISGRGNAPPCIALSGIIMGLGIVGMHYTGMAATRGHAGLHYGGVYVVLSVVIAICASTAALWLAVRNTDLRQRLVAAVVMGFAISGMHYTAMAGTVFAGHGLATEAAAFSNLDRAWIALAVAGITLLILALALIASLFDRRVAIAEAREALLRQALDTIPIMVWQARPDGLVEYVNKRVLDYTGSPLQESSESWWRAVVHPADLALFQGWWRGLAAGCAPADIEVRLRRFDGACRSAEDALRSSEAYLAEAQCLSRTGSFGWRIDNGDIFWSSETYRIFAVDRARKPDIDLIMQRTHPDDRAGLNQAIDEAVRRRCPIEVAHRLLLPDGAVRHVKVVAHATSDRSSGIDYIGAVTDVTEAKLAEQALHAAQAELAHAARVSTLGELAASIAHEVNQPIAAIVASGSACLNWLQRDTPDLGEVRHTVNSMIGDGQRAAEVIRRLRALTRKGEPQKTPLEINQVIDEALVLVEREILAHRVVLRKEFADGLPAVPGDRIQLQQVMINLVMNSLDAMASVVDRSRELTIRSECRPTDEILVTVQDTGVGIDPARADKLFDAFFSTKRDGMGMGLRICRSILKAHGGQLWAARNHAVGASFQFTLPSQNRVEEHVELAPTAAGRIYC
jgi:NO-binding membrane sensor protein with MHYT domain/signal transduction histidine kinase